MEAAGTSGSHVPSDSVPELPDSVWLRILSYVAAADLHSIGSVARVSRRFHALSLDRYVWHEVALVRPMRKAQMRSVLSRGGDGGGARHIRRLTVRGEGTRRGSRLAQQYLTPSLMQLIEERCVQLRELSVRNAQLCPMTAADLMPNLRKLDLTRSYVEARFFYAPRTAAPRFHRLRELRATGLSCMSALAPRAVHATASFTSLRSLHLSHCVKLDAPTVAELCGALNGLVELSLGHLPFVDDAAVQLIAGAFAGRLRRLCVAGCPRLSDAALAALLCWRMGAELHWLCANANAGRATLDALRAVARRTGRRVTVHPDEDSDSAVVARCDAGHFYVVEPHMCWCR